MIDDRNGPGRTCLVVGSPRRGSQSRHVAEELRELIEQVRTGWSTELLDLADGEVPIWSERLMDGRQPDAAAWSAVSWRLADCTSFIFVVPEWSGMAPPQVKNFFLMCGNNELAHKPALLVAVSAGEGGTYPIAELRASSYKNTRICYLPDHLIYRRLDENAPAMFERMRERARYTLGLLTAYDRALLSVRGSGKLDLDRFPYGQ